MPRATTIGLAVLALLSMSLSPWSRQERANSSTPFFAMDTNLRDGQARTPEQTAKLLAELGYEGYGHGGFADLEAWFAALDRHGLPMFTTYVGLNLDADPVIDPALLEAIPLFEGRGTMLWLNVQGRRTEGHAGDEKAVAAIRELADLAHEHGVSIALYPHTDFYVESVSDALRITEQVNRRNVGVSFNLCHWLKVEGDRSPREMLQRARPYLFRVSINGADGGDTKAMGWDRLIQPLDQGSYDVGAFLRILDETGYRGPIGMQGYGIPGDAETNLRRTIGAWKRLTANRESDR